MENSEKNEKAGGPETYPEKGDLTASYATNTTYGTTGSYRWGDYAPTWKNRWELEHKKDQKKWEEAERAYRFGWEMASKAQFRGKTWEEASPELQHQWELNHSGTFPWNEAKALIREIWP